MGSAADQALDVGPAPAELRSVSIARTWIGWSGAWPLGLPAVLLVLGAVIGYAFSLDQPVALERLVGLVVASLLALGAMAALRRVAYADWLLVGASLIALAGGVWVIAASGPDVFRGTVGSALNVVFRPVFGLVQLTDPVEFANTRFIVGYNGLADLCLVAIFGCGAVLLSRRTPRLTVVLMAIVAVGLVLLVGTGARGGLTGLAAGVCAAGLFAWPRRYALPALLGVLVALAIAAVGILDKGLEFSSTAGRLTYWGDLARLLAEFPLTGVGLGVDTAYQVATQFAINPDPERVFYAHNTFVQSYLEQGPLGALGMLALPVVAVAAAVVARLRGVDGRRQPLLMAGLGVIGGLEAHGLTDQVVTTNVGTGLVLFALAAVVASLSAASLSLLSGWVRRAAVALAAVAAVVLIAFVALPAGRAQALLNFGGLKLDQALAADPGSDERSAALSSAETLFVTALEQDDGHSAALRDLAWVRSARFDDTGALSVLERAAASPRIDAFDMLQIAHVYRDLGFVDEAYAWASRAYAATGRSVEDVVMLGYSQSTLNDANARTLAAQAEAAMTARHFGEASALFEQALTFEPSSAYLRDRIGAAERAVAKYGG